MRLPILPLFFISLLSILGIQFTITLLLLLNLIPDVATSQPRWQLPGRIIV